jgi:hypothetical protein
MTARDEAPNAAGEGAPWTSPKLRIDLDGDWYDDDVQVTHAGILTNLRAGLRRDAQGYFIQTRVRIPVEVADAPFVVTRFAREGGPLVVHLNDGTQESVDPGTLRVGAADVPYCAVKGGAFEARFSRAAAHQLWALAEHDERAGESVLRQGGRDYPLRRAG